MLILNKIKDVDCQLFVLKKEAKTIGFVPTMGALHSGHISLIRASKQACDVTICSIFVNPTQFNDKSDYNKYPVTIERDMALLEKAGCDILFVPSVKEMYPKGFANNTKINFGFIANTLEGEFRPGHFNGMAQVVEKLLRIVKPDRLFMGQKDYQQQLIVKELIKKRGFNTKLVVVPTVREKDGLAMSSRNVRLSVEARKLAVEISKTLKAAKKQIGNRKSAIINIESDSMKALAKIPGSEVEYFSIRNANTLKPVVRKTEKMVALAAVKIGGVRLIDNMLL